MKVRSNQERAKDEDRAGVQELGVIEDPAHHQGQGQQDAPSSGRPIMDTPGAASFHHPGQPKLQRDLTTLNVLNYFFQSIPKVRPESSRCYCYPGTMPWTNMLRGEEGRDKIPRTAKSIWADSGRVKVHVDLEV